MKHRVTTSTVTCCINQPFVILMLQKPTITQTHTVAPSFSHFMLLHKILQLFTEWQNNVVTHKLQTTSQSSCGLLMRVLMCENKWKRK